MNRIFIIAIADPDPGFCAYCKKIFEHRGYVVIVSNSPNELYQAVSEELVDLVVLSTDFPDRNATDICYDIRKIPEYFNLPIIFTSAELDESEILYCLGVGGSDFLIKPISDQELLAKISFALHTFNKMNDRFGGLPLGCRVGGRYEVVGHIDSGGFSNVYKAVDVTSVHRIMYAVKVFDFPFTEQSTREQLYSFLREAYQLCKLNHEAAVKIHDFGQFGSIIFIAMEYVDGEPVDELIEQNGPMDEVNAAFLAFELCDVLNYLDQKDMLHRDIKPDNIMITKQGAIKLVDFGLCKQKNEQTLSLDEDQFKGTAQFVSPEYIRGEGLTIASDLYALGISLYYIVSGYKPFDGNDFARILHQQMNEAPPHLSTLQTQISPEFVNLIMQMLEKDVSKRPSLPDAMEVLSGILSDNNPP